MSLPENRSGQFARFQFVPGAGGIHEYIVNSIDQWPVSRPPIRDNNLLTNYTSRYLASDTWELPELTMELVYNVNNSGLPYQSNAAPYRWDPSSSQYNSVAAASLIFPPGTGAGTWSLQGLGWISQFSTPRFSEDTDRQLSVMSFQFNGWDLTGGDWGPRWIQLT